MIVSHARRFIFFHNPKCAGMSFRETLQPYHDDAFSFWGIYRSPFFRNSIDHSHLRLRVMHTLFPHIFACTETYNSVIFVRSPYARFLAALNEHFKKFQPQISLATMTPAQRVTVIEQFITKALHISRITTDWRFVHFSPQIWLLKLGGRTIPRHIIPMDESGTFTQTALTALELPDLVVPWNNKSPVDLTAALKSPLVMNFIHELYEDDFEFFKGEKSFASFSKRSAF